MAFKARIPKRHTHHPRGAECDPTHLTVGDEHTTLSVAGAHETRKQTPEPYRRMRRVSAEEGVRAGEGPRRHRLQHTCGHTSTTHYSEASTITVPRRRRKNVLPFSHYPTEQHTKVTNEKGENSTASPPLESL
jgi:hypothetical protein